MIGFMETSPTVIFPSIILVLYQILDRYFWNSLIFIYNSIKNRGRSFCIVIQNSGEHVLNISTNFR